MPLMLMDMFVTTVVRSLTFSLFVHPYSFCFHLFDLGANSTFQARSGDSMVKLECQAFDLQCLEQRVLLVRQPEELCIATFKLQLKASMFKHSHSYLCRGRPML